MLLLPCSSSLVCPTSTSADPGLTPPAPLRAEQVFHQHVSRLYSLALRLLGSETDAEDVIQDVLVHILDSLHTVRGEAELSLWLSCITVRAALAHRSRQTRRAQRQANRYPTAIPCNTRLPGTRASAERPEQDAWDEETRQRVENALADLPALFRQVYVLADVEGLPVARIGKLLSLSSAQVTSRLHRARLMMRDACADLF